jgi:hypothetical protein
MAACKKPSTISMASCLAASCLTVFSSISADRTQADISHQTALWAEASTSPGMNSPSTPDGFVGKTDEFICSILVHEMTHCWQEHFGAKKKREDYRYHDREWALKMKSMGLQPSNTGMVGGKETGVQMAHYIIPGAPFVQSYEKLAATGWKLNLQSAYRPGGTRPPNSKVKSTCPSCGGNAWSKPNYQLACVACGNVPMVAEVVVVQSYDQVA